jgi:hypothetical protein
MSCPVVLLTAAGILLAAPAAAPASDAGPVLHSDPSASIWVQPLGAIATGLEGALYLPIGTNVQVGRRSDLVVELTPTRANWYGCSTRSLGGWSTAGFALFSAPERTGWFLQPKLIGRYFHTSGGVTSLDLFPCDHLALQGHDFELRAGVDVGFAWRWEGAAVAAAVGASAGYCWNCVGDLIFLARFEDDSRQDRPSVGVNPNVLRIGVAF